MQVKTHVACKSDDTYTLLPFSADGPAFRSSCVSVKSMHQTGKAVADETEKGWYIQWIDRDPRLIAMQEAAARREKADLDDEEKQVTSEPKQTPNPIVLVQNTTRNLVDG